MQSITTAVGMERCRYCGLTGHIGLCPLIKAVEYYPDDSVKRVEMKTSADYVPLPTQPSAPQVFWPGVGPNFTSNQ